MTTASVKVQGCEELYAGVWKNLRSNLSARKSVRLFGKFFPKEMAKKIRVSYLALRFVDDGVDTPWNGKTPDKRKIFLRNMKNLFFKKELEESKETAKIMEGYNPLNSLMPKPNAAITLKHTENLIRTFHSLHNGDNKNKKFLEENLRAFFEGMEMDLEKEGNLFTQKELESYFEKIQTIPLIIVVSSVMDLKNDFPKDITYAEFYQAMDDVSQGIMLMKSSRGKELIEDVEMNRIYFSKEELDAVGVTKNEFLKITKVDPKNFGVDDVKKLKDNKEYCNLVEKLSKIIFNRVNAAFVRFERGAEVFKKLPNESVLGFIKRFMAAYGYIVKKWAEKLNENNYNPIDPEAKGGYVNIEPNNLDFFSLYFKAKLVSNWRFWDNSVYNEILKWAH